MDKILIVDDELSVRESFSAILEGKYTVQLAASGEAALKIITENKIDLVFLDIRMPGLDGLETLKRIKEINPQQEVIMVTAVNDVSKASAAIKLGAHDYLVKPFEIDAILKLTEETLRQKSLQLERKSLEFSALKEEFALWGLEDLKETLVNIATRESKVLILGEPGTEREKVALFIHKKGITAGAPFISFDLPFHGSSYVIQEILFGSKGGTTIVELNKKIGLLESAENGTLLLNNIEHLPLDLLSFLSETKQPRLIASSSTNLVEKNKQIYDFFSEATIILPPLRERLLNFPELLQNYLELFNQKYGKEIKFSPDSLEVFNSYSWPGNFTELENLLEKMVLSFPGTLITARDLPLKLLISSSSRRGGNMLEIFEKKFAQKIWQETNNLERTAALLEITPTVLSLLLSPEQVQLETQK